MRLPPARTLRHGAGAGGAAGPPPATGWMAVVMPNGDLAKGNWEQVEWAVKVAASLGRRPATTAEARRIMGIRKE